MVKVPLPRIHFSLPTGCVYEVTYMTPEGVLFRSLPTSFEKAEMAWSMLVEQKVFRPSMRPIPPKEAYTRLMDEVRRIREEIEKSNRRPVIGLGSDEEAKESREKDNLKLSDLADELEAQARELPVN